MPPTDLSARFRERFERPATALYRAPGRINLIGEHTDYNDGFVLPAAIDREIRLAFAPNGTDTCRLYAADPDEAFTFSAEALPAPRGTWSDYLVGVVDQWQRMGLPLASFDAAFDGDIPAGAGLSSSAALTCSLAFALNEHAGRPLSRPELARLAQRAENDYVGLRCGVMDQFASLLGQAERVFRLDCRSLAYEYFPAHFGDYQLVLFDSCVKHALADSAYNERRAQCEAGVQTLQNAGVPVESLRDATPETLDRHAAAFEPTVLRRCRYVVAENARVLAATEALRQEDFSRLGALLYASHRGLQHDYEVSCPELDLLVDQTVADAAVLGARLMGGGFGGCTLNLIAADQTEAVHAHLSAAFAAAFGRDLPAYAVNISEGVGVV